MPIPLPTLDPLPPLTIATPCTVPWGEMRGDDRSRFCHQCERQVFDLSAMTTAEVVKLLSNPGGRPCVRLYRRPDGRVLTADCPVGLQTRLWRGLRRRAAWAASLFAVLFLPACRTASQGMLIHDYSEAISQQSPADDTHSVPSAAHADSVVREPEEQLQPGNALAQFAGNKFELWTISHRIDIPLEHKGVEEAPMPRRGE